MTVTADRIDTATVLFTDLVGSTATRGAIMKHTGDGLTATFPAAVDAVAAGA